MFSLFKSSAKTTNTVPKTSAASLVAPTASASSIEVTQTAEDFERLLFTWASQWCQEHNNVALDWFEYDSARLEQKLGKNHRLVKGNHHLSYKDVTPTDVVTTESPEVNTSSILGGERNGWRLAAENSTHIEQSTGFSTTKTLTSQKQITWTTGVTLNLGATLGAGIPFLVEGKTTMGVALSQSRATITNNTKSEAQNFSQTLKVPPGKKAFVAVRVQAIEAKTSRICTVHLQGNVVVCGKKKMACPEIITQTGKAYKWSIPIHQVFLDLERYAQKQPELNQRLANFKHEGTNISFELRGEEIDTTIMDAFVVFRDEDISGWTPLDVHSTTNNNGPTQVSSVNSANITHISKGMAKTQTGNAIKVLSKKDYELEEKRNDLDIKFANSVAGEKFIERDGAQSKTGNAVVVDAEDVEKIPKIFSSESKGLLFQSAKDATLPLRVQQITNNEKGQSDLDEKSNLVKKN